MADHRTSSTSLPPPPSSKTPHDPSTFPQPTLTRLPSTSSVSSDDQIDAATTLVGVHPPNIDMEPSSSSHRRRRSSLMNSLDPAAHSKRRASTGRNGKQEESKLLANADSDGSKEMEDLTEDEGLQDDEETGLTGNDKERRRGRRRRNTLLDQRIASEVKITPEEKKEADQHVVKKILINGLLIGLWYVFSLSISIVSPLSPSVG